MVGLWHWVCRLIQLWEPLLLRCPSQQRATVGAVERLAVPGGCGRDCGVDEATQDARVACGCQPKEHPGSSRWKVLHLGVLFEFVNTYK